MSQSEQYLFERAEFCHRLADEELDPEMRDMLRDLEQDYRAKAKRARTVETCAA